MENQEKCRECFNCGYYSPYYTKGYFKFNKVRVGHCRVQNKNVGKHECCDKWAPTKYRYSCFSKRLAQKELHNILERLAEIRQIMEENAGNE